MAKNKKPVSRKRRPRKQESDRTLRVLLASLFLVGFLVAALALLTYVQRSFRSPSAPVVTPRPVVPAPPANGGEDLANGAIQLEIERALWRGGISFAGMKVTQEGEVVHYHLAAACPGGEWLETLQGALERELDRLGVEPAGIPVRQVSISRDGAPLFLLHFQSPAVAPPQRRPRARIAIIVDDLGRDLQALRGLLAVDLDLTMAVMPEEPHSRQTAEMSHRAGREVLVHMPMEPESYPDNDPGPGALLLGQDVGEIQRRVRRMFDKVPHAAGGNNHMGSRFTQYREGMQSVFAVMREGGWFFVDSRTSPGSVAVDEAGKARVPCVARDIFLDNNRNVEAIARQLRETVKLARSRRRVVAICHPYPETVAALRQEAAFLRQQDIEVVPVSRLVTGAKGP